MSVKKILALVLAVVLVCSLVPAVAAAESEIRFDFGENSTTAEHVDGKDIGTAKTITEGGYELALTNCSKAYDGAFDLKGNSCLKLGTSSVVGTVTFEVPEGINEVVIYAAKYKAKNSKINVNGTEYTLTKSSNDGAYEEIVVDTSATKSVTIATVASNTRTMIDAIVWKGTASGGTTTPTTPTEPEATEPATSDPAADSTLTIVEAAALGTSKEHNVYTEGKYYVSGVIVDVYNTIYGNMHIADENGNQLTIYGTYSADGSARYDAMEVKPVAGDTVTIYGPIGQYNGDPQIKNGWITEHTPNTDPTEPTEPAPDDGTVLTIAEANELGAAQATGGYTTNKYKVSGTIVEVDNTTYGNMTITDGTNYLYIYGTYSADGSARYDAMEVKPVAGDEVTVYGVIGNYSNNPQMKNGWIVEHTPGEPEATEPVEEPDAEISFADTANRVSQDTEQQVWQQNGITVTNDKAEGSDIIDSSNPVRFYKNSKVTIAANGMTKIVVNCNNLTYGNALVASLESVANITVTQNASVVTIEFAEAVDSFEVTLTEGQVRVNAIGIYVEAAEEIAKGDFTGDGEVTNEDVVYLLWYTLFPEENPISIAADFNGDGDVTNEDVVYLLWHTLFPDQNPL